jgi:hypothetical protein
MPKIEADQSAMFADEPVPRMEQILCVEREIRMREKAYPRWVAAGKLKQDTAARELTVMRAVLETLRGMPT